MIRNIIFDYGSVLIRTDCRRVYAPLFGSWEKADWFRTNIVEPEWIERLDRGDDYGECIAAQQAKYPDYAEAIALYDSRYTDFLVGEMPGMHRLLSQLRTAGYHLYGLSNYSHKVYDIQATASIFRLIEGQVISSDVHITKPNSLIYKHLLNGYALRADECLFIDDRKANTDAAEAVGIRAMVFPDIPFTRRQILEGVSKEYSDTTTPEPLAEFEKRLQEVLR